MGLSRHFDMNRTGRDMLGLSVAGELPGTGDKIQPIAMVAGAAAAAGGWRGTQGEYAELMRRLIIGRTDGVREALAQAENAFKVSDMTDIRVGWRVGESRCMLSRRETF